MADGPSTASIALLLAGKVWRNLPAVYDPAVSASARQSEPMTRPLCEHIADEKRVLVE
jgi:hypothetical protein